MNLNPLQGFQGWFTLPKDAENYEQRLLVKVDATIIDPYDREHPLLPFGYCHERKGADGKPYWYYEPAPDAPEILNAPR